jgi:ketosteroid isomerase-like protein
MNRRTAIIAGASGLVAAAAITSVAQAADSTGPELEKVKALLKAHDDAMTNHDLEGVLKCLTEKAAIMGTGPGEMWSGPEEITDAYKHFFEGYDKGQQEFEYHFKVGDLGTEMGWLMASGNVKCKKGGKGSTFPLNLSLTVAKSGGDWKIASMHFSTLTGPDKATKATKAAK